MKEILKNPQSILIKNKYYPIGLTSGQIYDYYLKNKELILKNLINKICVLFLIPINTNEIIVKRKIDNKQIYINRYNYEHILKQKVVSIAIETEKETNEFVIDVDSTIDISSYALKESVDNLLNFLNNNINDLISYKILSTSTGFHVYFYCKNKYNINDMRNNIENKLNNVFGDIYNINKRGRNGVTFDLSTMYNKSSHTVENCLNRNGLICKNITKIFKTFDRTSLKII